VTARPRRAARTASSSVRAAFRASSCSVVGIERGVAGRIGLPVADIAIELSQRSGWEETQAAKPVRDAVPDVFRPFRIAMHDDREQPPSQVGWVIPAAKFDLLRAFGVLAVSQRRVGIAAIVTRGARLTGKLQQITTKG
jgi:hypothetical protein